MFVPSNAMASSLYQEELQQDPVSGTMQETMVNSIYFNDGKPPWIVENKHQYTPLAMLRVLEIYGWIKALLGTGGS